MGKTLSLFMSLLLAGCAQFPDLQHALGALSPASAGPSPVVTGAVAKGDFNFDWVLSGDRSIAPLQIFDNGQQTWLQFASGSPVPALFARTSAAAEPGDRLLLPRKMGDFVVVDEVPEALIFRGGHLQAQARRTTMPSRVPLDSAASLSELPLPDAVTPIDPASSASYVEHPETALLVSQVAEQIPGTGVIPEAALPESEELPTRLPVAGIQFTVSRSDGTLRQALSRWAREAGWDFGAEHWMVEVDIPIIGAASFNEPFVQAVQALVASTELAERPLQPCFYSNRVLRVVPYAQPCNRSRRGAAS